MRQKKMVIGLENLIGKLAETELIQNIAAICNHVSFPFTRLRVNNGGRYMIAHTFDRFIALWLWRLGFLESYESKLLAKLCHPGMVAVDIGANIGHHTLAIAHYLGDNGVVWAFEPEPGNFATLQRNIRLNNCLNINPVNKAIGARSGKEWLYVSQSHNGNHCIYQPLNGKRRAIPIDLVAMDDFFPASQRIDLIKMDIEGAEGFALTGMKRCLAKNPNLIILMEFWPARLTQAGFIPEQVLSDLQTVGFVFEYIDERQQKLIKIDNIASFVSSFANGTFLNILARPHR